MSTLPLEISSTASCPDGSPILATTVPTSIPFSFKYVGCTRRGRDRESELDELACGANADRLVAVGEREEHRAGLGQLHARGELALGEGQPEGEVDAHHLARGPHLRTEDGVGIGEATEGKDGFLHGQVITRRPGRSAALRLATPRGSNPSSPARQPWRGVHPWPWPRRARCAMHAGWLRSRRPGRSSRRTAR